MRRAEAVLQVLRVLKRRRIATAAEIADEIGCSVPSVYRYIRDLEAMYVPIEAERGVGYRLKGYEIPSWYTEDEVLALLLGAQLVREWADGPLGEAAGSLLAKIGEHVPEGLRGRFDERRLTAKRPARAERIDVDLLLIRKAAVEERRLRIEYEDATGKLTERVVNPLELRLYPPWVLIAWCEEREDVRMFRVDRMRGAAVVGEAD